VLHPRVATSIHVELGPERLFVDGILGSLVNDRTLIASERRPLRVVLDDVLAELRTDVLEEEAQVADQGIVAKKAVLGLE
jgi:hypothetical protein